MTRLNPGYVVVNLGKNAVVPLAVRALPGRRVLGMDGERDAVAQTLDRLAVPLAASPVPLRDARVLELGPGRTPQICAAALLAGARSAVGVDVRTYIDFDAADASRYTDLVDLLTKPDGAGFVAAAEGSAATIRARAEALGTHWPLQIHEFDGSRIPLPDDSIDLVLSKSVLEHVPGPAIEPLLGDLARVMRPGAVMIHVIDLRDHLHVIGDDAVHGDWLHALRVPEKLFRAMFSNRATSINRWRTSEWLDAFAAAGFDLFHEQRQSFPLSEDFDRRRLHPRWRTMDLDELAVGLLTVGLRRPAHTTAARTGSS